MLRKDCMDMTNLGIQEKEYLVLPGNGHSKHSWDLAVLMTETIQSAALRP